MVQEASIRWLRRGDEPVRSVSGPISLPSSPDCASTSSNRLTPQRVSYAGPWLPEPVVMDETSALEQADSLSLAFLVLLEELTPLERAAYLLHDIFGYTFDEVAGLARTVCACVSSTGGAGTPAHRDATATLRRRPAARTGADRSFPRGVRQRRPLGTARDALGGRRGLDGRRGQGACRRAAGGRTAAQLALPAARGQEGRRRAARAPSSTDNRPPCSWTATWWSRPWSSTSWRVRSWRVRVVSNPDKLERLSAALRSGPSEDTPTQGR